YPPLFRSCATPSARRPPTRRCAAACLASSRRTTALPPKSRSTSPDVALGPAAAESTRGASRRRRPLCFRENGSACDHVDDAAAAAVGEGHRARSEREQRVVLATADVVAGVEVRAALTNDDLAGVDDLAAEALHAQVLGVRVATVARGARALLVCHEWSSP